MQTELPADVLNILNNNNASSWDMGSILIGIFFSIVGWYAFRYGKTTQSAKHMVLGIVLMGYAYFISNMWISLLVGLVLTALLFFP